jgi:flagellin
LAEQAGTGTYSSAQRSIMDNEFDELSSEIERIAGSAQFNGTTLLNSASGSISVMFGSSTDKITINTADMSQSGLSIDALAISSEASAQAALTALDTAIETANSARATFGAKMNRLENTINVIGIQVENLQASESRISDVDVATEMAAMTKNQVLAQAGVAMLAQANTVPQMALSLLR